MAKRMLGMVLFNAHSFSVLVPNGLGYDFVAEKSAGFFPP
jgi:hypothetical protein